MSSSSAPARSARPSPAFLAGTGDYRVTVADQSAEALAALGVQARVEHKVIDVANGPTLGALLNGKFAVLTAAPYHLTDHVAQAAKAAGAHYLDLTEDVACHPRGQGPGRRRQDRLHPAVRPGARLHHHRRRRPGPPLRHSARRAPARRRPAALSVQRAELQSHLVHRRGDQRILRALRGHRRRRCRARPARWRNARSSPSTASPTRPSTPPAAWARCARPWTARCATSTTAPSAIPATRRS